MPGQIWRVGPRDCASAAACSSRARPACVRATQRAALARPAPDVSARPQQPAPAPTPAASKRAAPQPLPARAAARPPSRGDGTPVPTAAPAAPPAVLAAAAAAALQQQAPPDGTPLARGGGAGVKTATEHFHLPAPAVAVRNLVEQAQYAQLCTTMSKLQHRRQSYPFGTVVDFATDGAGMPLFCLSPLDIHARNLQDDARCSLVVQMPGWQGLADPRVTIFGDVYKLPTAMQEEARAVFLAKHAADAGDRWVLSSYSFFRMHRMVDLYFQGGFGTVVWMDVADYLGATPDAIVAHAPQRTVKALDREFSAALAAHLLLTDPGDEARIISVDALGADVRARRGREVQVARVCFGGARAETLEGARAAMRGALRGAAGGGAGGGRGEDGFTSSR